MKRVICSILLVAFVFFLTVPMTASATEIPDWDTVDWESREWRDWLDNEVIWSALEDWLRTEATYSQLFLICTSGDGATGEMLAKVCCVRFLESPDEFLVALTLESEEIQTRTFYRIIYGMYGYTVRGQKLLSQYKQNPVVSGGSEETNQLLLRLLDHTEKSLGENFTQPDPDYVEVDWDNMDWEVFDWNKLDERFYKTWLQEWFYGEADLLSKFQMARHNQHSVQGPEYRELFARSFRWTATEMILEISRLSQEEQDAFILILTEDMPEYFEKEDIAWAFDHLKLPANASWETKNLAEKAAQAMEEKYNIEITVPKTGDPVAAVMAALVLSGCGIMLLRKKKIV